MKINEIKLTKILLTDWFKYFHFSIYHNYL